MLNPSDPDPNSGSYVGLLDRITGRVEAAKVDEQILNLVRQVFSEELSKENMTLTQSEKARLLRQVTRAVLADILETLDTPN